MDKIIVASNNQKKIKEIKAILEPLNIQVLSLKDINIDVDPEENGTSFIENAFIKAREIYDIVKLPVIADDSGLEVQALNNQPGIFSARYAGEHKNDEDNLNLLLENLKGIENRKSRYVCAIALIIDKDHQYSVEEYLEGEIVDQRQGENGFGYDPIFYLPEYQKTTAQLDPDFKNSISHRAKALKKIEQIIKDYNNAY